MIHLTATSIGPIAADILAAHHEVEVIAAFEKSFYLMTHGGLVCVGAEAIGRGPINVTLANADKVDWRAAGVFHEVEGVSKGHKLTIGEDVAIDTAPAVAWQAPEWPAFDLAAARGGLSAVRAAARAELPAEGLSRLVLADKPAPETPEARAAAAQIGTLRAELPAAMRSQHPSTDLVRAATLLIGLGPGLTPSGDDVIGGSMLALTALGQDHLRDHLWDAIAPELGDLTTEISAMHLSAAADGLGAEAFHIAANAILSGDTAALPGALNRVSRIGHCSGWDTLAGFALTIEAALRNGKGA